MRKQILQIIRQGLNYPEQTTDQILAIFEETIPKEKEIRKYTPVSWLEKEYGYNEAIAEMKAKVKEGR